VISVESRQFFPSIRVFNAPSERDYGKVEVPPKTGTGNNPTIRSSFPTGGNGKINRSDFRAKGIWDRYTNLRCRSRSGNGAEIVPTFPFPARPEGHPETT